MNKLLTLSALLVLLTFASCSDKRTVGNTKRTDSTHVKEYITKISLQEPDRALAIIDTMEMNKEALPYELNYLRFAIYVNGFSDMKMAEYYGKQVLKDSVELKKDVKCHFTILNTLADIANQNSQYAQSIKYAKEAYDLAKRNNVKEYEVSATEALALSLIKLGDDEKGFKLFAEGKDEILKSLDQDVDFRKVNNAYSFVGNYMESLITTKRYDEAGRLIPDLLNITKKMEAVDDVIDGAVEYRQLHTYGLLMKYYDKTGNTKESEKYLALIQKSQLAGTNFVEALVSEHYLNVGDVKRLAEKTASIRENAVANNDTLSIIKTDSSYGTVSHGKTIAVYNLDRDGKEALSDALNFTCTITHYTSSNYNKEATIRGYTVLRGADGIEFTVYIDYSNENYRSISLDLLVTDMAEAGAIDTANNISYLDVIKFRKETE